jgi:hypothetical protein
MLHDFMCVSSRTYGLRAPVPGRLAARSTLFLWARVMRMEGLKVGERLQSTFKVALKGEWWSLCLSTVRGLGICLIRPASAQLLLSRLPDSQDHMIKGKQWRTSPRRAIQQNALGVLDIHQFCYMGWHCPGCKGTPKNF